MRVAAFDCGTNSLRLLVADVDPGGSQGAGGRLVDVTRRMEIVRLGQGVDATGEITPEAMARALAVTREYAAVCERAGVERVRFVATSASRDARNAAEFAAAVRGLLGVDPEVVPGAEEAALSFAGAVRGLAAPPLPAAVAVAGDGAGAGDCAGDAEGAPTLVVDLGGGSTEFVVGTLAGGISAACSVDVGCVRLTERHLRSDPPAAGELEAARADVRAALARVDAVADLARVRRLIGVAGSVTTVTAHALRLPRYDAARIHGAELPIGAVRAACADLLAAPHERRAALPYLHPGRVDVIGAGALVWDLVVAHVAAASGVTRVSTSEHDILDGIAWSLAER